MDLHDLITQIFVGKDIDLDNFLPTTGPDKTQHAHNISIDSYAAAKFFHFTIQAILETLFQVRATGGGRVQSGMGVMGEVAAYFGAVESQGCGSLHLHLLLWLKHAPMPSELQQMLKTEEFRDHLKIYIAANVHAYLPGLESRAQCSDIQMEKEIAYSRPPNPDSPNYEEELATWEL